MLWYNYLTVPSGGPAAVIVDELGGAERVSCTQGLASNQSVYILDKVPDEDTSVYWWGLVTKFCSTAVCISQLHECVYL